MSVEFRGFSYKYKAGYDWVLRDLNFKIEPGEFVLIAGRSGSGKSTIIRCINGLIPHKYGGVYEGDVLVNGERVSDLSLQEISSHVGTVMQDVEKQLVASRVEEDVAFGLCNLGLPRNVILERVRNALEEAGISHLSRRLCYELSGGQKQKAAIAGVIAFNPEIFLFDEPLSNLDPASRVETVEFLRGKWEEGKTIIVVEHKLEDLIRGGVQRIILIDSGRIVFDGSPEKLINAPNSLIELQVPMDMYLLKTLIKKGLKPPRRNFREWLKRNVNYEKLPSCNKGGSQGKVRIAFRNVSFTYPSGVEALKDINLEIREGERIAILGNNGAGKSTLALLMIGILKPTKGEVLVDGTPTTSFTIAQLARKIGIAFQNPNHMLFSKTVYDEVAFGPRNIGFSEDKIRKVVENTLKICSIDHLRDRSPFITSFGERRRITVASILSMLPEILVIDEPSSGQDYKSYTEFMNFIVSLMGRMVVKTLIIITHNIDLAVQYGDRGIFMSEGKIVADGPLKKLLTKDEVLKRCNIRRTSLVELGLYLSNGECCYTPSEIINSVKIRR